MYKASSKKRIIIALWNVKRLKKDPIHAQKKDKQIKVEIV